MEQPITWPEVSAAGDRWHALQQQLESHRQHTVELEQQVEQALQEFQRGLSLLGLGAPRPSGAPQLQPGPTRSTAADLVPCAHGCGQQIKPRGQTAHNRFCPTYTRPATQTHDLPSGTTRLLTAPANTDPAAAAADSGSLVESESSDDPSLAAVGPETSADTANPQ